LFVVAVFPPQTPFPFLPQLHVPPFAVQAQVPFSAKYGQAVFELSVFCSASVAEALLALELAKNIKPAIKS